MNTATNVDITTCDKCGSSLSTEMKFCPHCGANLAALERRRAIGRLSGKGYAALAIATLGLFGAAIGIQQFVVWRHGPEKPTKAFERTVSPEEKALAEDPKLKALQDAVAAAPGDLTKLRALASYLAELLRNRPDAPPPLVFEAIDTLSQILKAVPDDPTAIVMMADLSFDQRAFGKAIDLYSRYLKLQPDDLGARARYASTLTFVGKFDEAVKELEEVLQRDPKHFPAMAYLSITYAQRGDKDKAKEIAQRALAIAPSEEARQRFSQFVSSLDAPAESAPQEISPRGNIPKEGDSASGSAPTSTESGIAGFISAVRNNPIAGPKFVRYEDTDPAILKLFFSNFPMAQMPPFAKEKFFSGLRSKIAEAKLSQVKEIIFLDADSGIELEKLQLP